MYYTDQICRQLSQSKFRGLILFVKTGEKQISSQRVRSGLQIVIMVVCWQSSRYVHWKSKISCKSLHKNKFHLLKQKHFSHIAKLVDNVLLQLWTIVITLLVLLVLLLALFVKVGTFYRSPIFYLNSSNNYWKVSCSCLLFSVKNFARLS